MTKTTPVVSALSTLLADTYTLYLKTQNFHWNVTGTHFTQLHELFGVQYAALTLAIDEIAERIRALGAHAPGSFAEFSDLTNLKEAPGKAPAALTMVSTLAKDHRLVSASAAEVIRAAQKAGDEVTADLAIGRSADHDKHAWMLESTAQ